MTGQDGQRRLEDGTHSTRDRVLTSAQGSCYGVVGGGSRSEGRAGTVKEAPPTIHNPTTDVDTQRRTGKQPLVERIQGIGGGCEK